MASTVALRWKSSAAPSEAQFAHSSRTKTNRVDRFITKEPFGQIVEKSGRIITCPNQFGDCQYPQSSPILPDSVFSHHFHFISNPHYATFDDPSQQSALTVEPFRQAVVYPCDRAAGFARFEDLDD